MSYLFQYSVLRYMHDSMTQEFVNIGVLLYAPQQNYLDLCISHKYKRVSQMFDGIDPLAFQRAKRMVEKAVHRVSKSLEQGSLLEKKANSLEILLPKILPKNDAALSFSTINGGITKNLEDELNYLYHRLVEYYLPNQEKISRTDSEVWVQYVKVFREKNILPHLQEVTIPTQTFSYKFDHAFKNDRWHPIEPVSFDLSNQTYIKDKAAKWIGKAVTLSTSNEVGTLYILSGKPNDPALVQAYEAAKYGLEKNTQGITVRVIDENDAETFSEEFSAFIKKHITQTD